MSGAGNGPADYFLEGAWNFRCQTCFKKLKSPSALRNPPGDFTGNYYVCERCFETPNPQNFVRGIPDNQSVPWSTGDPPPVFITATSPAEVTHYNQELNHWMLDSMFLG